MNTIKEYCLTYGKSCYNEGFIHGTLFGITLTSLCILIVVKNS